MNRTRWEYRTVTVDVAKFWGPKVEAIELDRLLNDLGETHWELASSQTISSGGTTKNVVMIFKRPVEEPL